MKFQDWIYSVTCLSFGSIIGAAIYEHCAVVPNWSAAPPQSLSMFQGEYGLDAGSFWQMIHPITLLLFILTTLIFWKSERRFNLLIGLAGYVVVLTITAIYFVPELISITTSDYSEQIDLELTNRAKTWEILSIIRLIFLAGLSIILFSGLTIVPMKDKIR